MRAQVLEISVIPTLSRRDILLRPGHTGAHRSRAREYSAREQVSLDIGYRSETSSESVDNECGRDRGGRRVGKVAVLAVSRTPSARCNKDGTEHIIDRPTCDKSRAHIEVHAMLNIS